MQNKFYHLELGNTLHSVGRIFFGHRGQATPCFPMAWASFRKKAGRMREMCVGVKAIESNTKQRAVGVLAEFGIVYI